MEPIDNDIRQLISSSRIGMNNPAFEDQCMQAILEQHAADKAGLAFRRKSFRFGMMAIVICLALIIFSIVACRDDSMFAIILQAFSVGIATFIIAYMKRKPAISL
ncbi:hypothetical protein ACQKLP_05985 [Chitinophaga sp. NPDC101104]|uniref:hypothetical protein n=1 Tax=Chitinophaga sp. NPDC101104 TaxID=3390561 RepID=UPI003D00EFB9